MKLKNHGKSTSNPEIVQISPYGIWLLVVDEEYFLSYEEFPWFREAVLSEIYNVSLVNDNHLHWPDLDVDLEIDCLRSPKRYPLKYK